MLLSCPACRCPRPDDTPLWCADAVPANSCALVADREQARAWPRRPLVLHGCRACGLVANAGFDASTQHYDRRYEETQACSAHFAGFERELAGSLDARYGLAGRRVLEVGCGKGSFLAALVAATGCRALGVDPSFDPARHPAPDRDDLRFAAEPLSEDHAGFAPQLLLCRHTLEHIHQVHDFLARCAAAAGPGTPVVIEVPDLGRVLREGAFWDLYYEHCSYFDAEALANAMAQAGIAVDAVELVFHGQYLLAHGRVAAPAVAAPRGVVHDHHALDATAAAWRARLADWQARGESTVLWGGGSKAVGFVSGVGDADALDGAVDINPRKQGRFLPGSGLPVLAPEALRALRPAHVVLLNPAYAGEVDTLLGELGVATDLVAVDALSAA